MASLEESFLKIQPANLSQLAPHMIHNMNMLHDCAITNVYNPLTRKLDIHKGRFLKIQYPNALQECLSLRNQLS